MKKAMTGLWAAILVCGAVAGASAGDSTNNVTPDTIAYWPFDTGAELTDASDNGHTLANTGAAFSAGAAVFNAAASSKLVTLSALPFSTYSNLTIECFVKMDINLSVVQPEFGFLYSTGATYAAPGSINFYQTDGTSLIGEFYNTSGGFDQETNQYGHYPIGISSWHHAAIVIDSSKSGADSDRLQLYVDNTRMKKSVLTSTHAELSDALFYIGTLGTQTGYHFTGQIDDIRITAAALSPGEFLQTRTISPIAYWPFNPGEELVDATGNGHTLANTGATFSADAAVFDAQNAAKLVTLSTLPFSTYSNLTIECFFNMAINLSTVQAEFGFLYSTGAAYETPGSINFYQTYGTSLIGDFHNTSGGFDQDNSQVGHYSIGISSWHHAAIVIDSGKSGTDPDRLQLYVDKIRMRPSYTQSTHAELSDALFYIGTLGAQTGYYFTGQIDDIRITATALSPSEFLQTRTRSVNTTAYWPFNPGEELVDATGNGHTLSNNSVTFANDAASFSSALSSGLSTDSAIPFEDSVDQTVEFFFHNTSQTDKHRMLLMTGNLNTLSSTLLCYGDPNADNLSYDIFNSGGELHKRLATGGINDGKWHHVALLVDSSKTGSERFKMYVDRVEQPVTIANSSNAVLLNNKLHIGKASTPDSFFYDGQMDDVRITAAALSPDEFLLTRTRARTANTNCIAYWPFNQGDELADASGNGYTLSNSSVSFAHGAACFSSALSSRLATLAALPFEDLDDVTVEFFFSTTNQTPAFRTLLMTGDTYGRPGTLICYGEPDLDDLVTDLYDSGSHRAERVATGNINDGKWHHVAIQVDSSKSGADPERLKMYVDRIEQRTAAAYSLDPVLRNNILYLGGQSLNNTAFFDGRMDDVRITGRLLSTSEFMSPMERTADYGCIAYWPFKAGRELEDASGNGHTLVNNNVAFQAGYALFDKELFSHLVTEAKLPFNDPIDLTLEYFVRTSYVPLNFSAFTHTGPVYGVPGTFSSYINVLNQLECDTWQIAGNQYNQERSSPGLLTDGEWHHVALVLERSAFEADPQNWFRLYVDGQRMLVSDRIFRCTNPFLVNNKLYLGRIGEQTTGFFEGILDDVRITGKALTPSEFMSQRSKSEGTLLLLR